MSKMTVSRAINKHPAINARTRQRVLAVARRLKYQPNQHARALATKRSYLIGMIVPDLMHSYFAEILRGVESIVRSAGYQILICNTDEDSAREISEVEALRNRTDGLIIASSFASEKTEAYKKLLRDGLKIVLIDRPLKGLACPTVTTDNFKVGRLATEYLIKAGHCRIGHLRGSAATTALDRFRGYRQALADHELKYDRSLVNDCGFLEDEGSETMKAWIAGGHVPQAIFAANDPAAIGAMRVLEASGFRVGRDIAVVGAGNIHYGDLLGVPLTTVDWSRTEMGKQAARLMIDLIEEERPARSSPNIILEPKLIVRRSSETTAGDPKLELMGKRNR